MHKFLVTGDKARSSAHVPSRLEVLKLANNTPTIITDFNLIMHDVYIRARTLSR